MHSGGRRAGRLALPRRWSARRPVWPCDARSPSPRPETAPREAPLAEGLLPGAHELRDAVARAPRKHAGVEFAEGPRNTARDDRRRGGECARHLGHAAGPHGGARIHARGAGDDGLARAYSFTETPLENTYYEVADAKDTSTALFEGVAFALSPISQPAGAHGVNSSHSRGPQRRRCPGRSYTSNASTGGAKASRSLPPAPSAIHSLITPSLTRPPTPVRTC